MEPNERHRLQSYYTGLDDDQLGDALAYGPGAYESSEVWKIIAEEAARRGLGVPNQTQLEAHWAAVQAEHDASLPPRLPVGWALYRMMTRLLLALVLFVALKGVVSLTAAEHRQEGWLVHLSTWLAVIGLALAAAWARHRQLAALRERLRGPASSRDAA
jgi:hypothetical protein